MIFDDGTCPALPMVKKFIKIAHETITVRKKAIAVHCKAGLGRTGCLIGAYLIYRYGFTANEVIAFMRFMRPGMVVGPQQHWLHLTQGTFREWWWDDYIKQKLALVLPSTPTKTLRHRHDSINPGQTATPPNGSQQGKRLALGEITHNEASPPATVMDENLPAPTPGQPRKAGKLDPRHHPYAHTISATFTLDQSGEKPDKEIVEMISHRNGDCHADGDIEEEWELRMLSRQTTSRSPQSNSSERRRAVSHSTITTTHTSLSIAGDKLDQRPVADVENWIQEPQAAEKVPRPRTPGVSKSGSGSGTLGISKMRGSPLRRSAESRDVKSGVRKTSGRVGSVGVSRSKS